MTRGFLEDEWEGRFGPADGSGGVERADLVDVALIVHRETKKAWLVSDTGREAEAHWLAKSQGERGLGVTFTVPRWIARQNRWVR